MWNTGDWATQGGMSTPIGPMPHSHPPTTTSLFRANAYAAYTRRPPVGDGRRTMTLSCAWSCSASASGAGRWCSPSRCPSPLRQQPQQGTPCPLGEAGACIAAVGHAHDHREPPHVQTGLPVPAFHCHDCAYCMTLHCDSNVQTYLLRG
jgi:hypothetical protein